MNDIGSISERYIYDVTEGPPSERVDQAVADVAGIDPRELPPLTDRVDPYTLNELFRGKPAGSVAFDYFEYTVIVNQRVGIIIQE